MKIPLTRFQSGVIIKITFRRGVTEYVFNFFNKIKSLAKLA